MTLFTMLGVVLSCLLAARDKPLWDAALIAADRRLGIVWPTILDRIDSLPVVALLLGKVAYHSLAIQMVACILVLAYVGIWKGFAR